MKVGAVPDGKFGLDPVAVHGKGGVSKAGAVPDGGVDLDAVAVHGGWGSSDCSPRRDDAVALRRLDVDSIDDHVAIAAIDSGVQWCPSSCVQGKLLEIASSLVSSSSQQ